MRAGRGRSSRVVLSPRRWGQANGDDPSRRWLKSPIHRGEHGTAEKNHRAGNAGSCRRPVVTMLVGRLPFSAHEAAGASAPGIPCALYLWRDTDFRITRTQSAPRECGGSPQTPSSFRDASKASGPGIHNHRRLLLERSSSQTTKGRGYGFRARPCGPPRNDERWLSERDATLGHVARSHRPLGPKPSHDKVQPFIGE